MNVGEGDFCGSLDQKRFPDNDRDAEGNQVVRKPVELSGFQPFHQKVQRDQTDGKRNGHPDQQCRHRRFRLSTRLDDILHLQQCRAKDCWNRQQE